MDVLSKLKTRRILILFLCLLMAGGVYHSLLSERPALANRALPTNLAYSTETTWLLPGLPALSAAAGYIPHNYSHGEALFQIDDHSVVGFRPGRDYPDMRIRNLAWSLNTAQYFYPEAYLHQPIEAFLRRQQSNGAINGILLPNGQATKQTTAVDEETSLIHAAYLYYRISYNTAWLEKPIDGVMLIKRLNQAASWLYTHRLDPQTELLWRGSTGALSVIEAESGPKTASIYDQSLAYMALLELAEMNAAVGDTTRADTWQTRAEALKSKTNALLWRPDQGVYQAQLQLTSSVSKGDDTGRVSIANALAAYAGVANSDQTLDIFSTLEKTRQAAGISKPGLSIYPYYPNQHSLNAEMKAGRHQNGGVWDWWGGVQIGAEFQRGSSEMARRHLLQVANDWQKNPGNILEWQSSTEPQQEGSHYFTTAAGTMGNAIINGLFGVDLAGHGLSLQPRLGLNDGHIRVYQPATDRYAAYSYDWDQNTTRLDYGTNAGGSVTIKVLKLKSEQINSVALNGTPVNFHTETIGNDTYTVVTAPGGQHSVEIIKNLPPPADESGSATNGQYQASQPGVVRNAVVPRLSEPVAPVSTVENVAAPPETPAQLSARRSQTAFVRFAGALLVALTALGLLVLAAVRRRTGLAFSGSSPRKKERSL